MMIYTRNIYKSYWFTSEIGENIDKIYGFYLPTNRCYKLLKRLSKASYFLLGRELLECIVDVVNIFF